MGAFVLIVAVMVSAAVFSDVEKSLGRFDSDRVAPPLPENVALYEAVVDSERPQGADEEPGSCTTTQHWFIAQAH